jgi:beta-galactosidase/beta-glucuronidase
MRSSTNKVLNNGSNRQGHRNIGGVLAFVLACVSLVSLISSGCIFKAAPKVYIKKSGQGRYQLMVSGKPYIVKGVCYNPIAVGYDQDYDWWSDPNKPWLTDGKLMKEMGVNTVRLYQAHEDSSEVKQVIRDLYERFGIRTIMGDWLGFWEYPCPLYGDAEFQAKVKKGVLDMVREYKDEPGVLFWILGN